jgi:uncharacterized protein
MKTLWWDFFGPRAEGTAQHFLVHLRDFLRKNECPEMPTGLRSEGAGHQGVYCSPPADFAPAIERSLRPRRIVDDAPNV